MVCVEYGVLGERLGVCADSVFSDVVVTLRPTEVQSSVESYDFLLHLKKALMHLFKVVGLNSDRIG